MDSGVEQGDTIGGQFDSMLAKLIVWGEDREMALARSARALGELEIEGVTTNIPFHRGIVGNDAFREARVSTNLLDRVGGVAVARRRPRSRSSSTRAGARSTRGGGIRNKRKPY